jgi:hypothetical protein
MKEKKAESRETVRGTQAPRRAHEDTTARLCFGSTRTTITLRQACDVIDLDIDTVAKSTLSLQPP